MRQCALPQRVTRESLDQSPWRHCCPSLSQRPCTLHCESWAAVYLSLLLYLITHDSSSRRVHAAWSLLFTFRVGKIGCRRFLTHSCLSYSSYCTTHTREHVHFVYHCHFDGCVHVPRRCNKPHICVLRNAVMTHRQRVHVQMAVRVTANFTANRWR